MFKRYLLLTIVVGGLQGIDVSKPCSQKIWILKSVDGSVVRMINGTVFMGKSG